MTKLSVNLNKVATLRNTRTIGIPSVTHAARLSLEAGAHGITVHPRPDGRHIRTEDIYDLAELLSTHPQIEFNIEGNPFHGYMEHALAVAPAQCTLVPDSPDAFTSNQGWDLRNEGERLRTVIRQLQENGSRVSLFMDAVPENISRAADAGADRVELYTEPFAAAFERGGTELERTLEAFTASAEAAAAAGLGINAGHDLNLRNLPVFLQHVPGVLEVSIGHALIADALEFGLAATIRQYLTAAGAETTDELSD